MHEKYKRKITFTMPLGTLIYDKIQFGLMNAGVKFQKAMDIDFVGERDIFIVVHLDDILLEM